MNTEENICAYPGCNARVSDPIKYCIEHNTRDRSNLIKIEAPATPLKKKLVVILCCPNCHDRSEHDYDDWCKTYLPKAIKIQCTEPGCDRVDLVYHKDKTEKD